MSKSILAIFKDKINVMNKWNIENLLQMDLIHKVATSGIIANAVLNAYWDRDYAHDNLGCPSEECVKSDWETTIPVCESYEKFIDKCKDTQMESKNQLTGYVGGEKVNITIKFDWDSPKWLKKVEDIINFKEIFSYAKNKLNNYVK